MRNRVCLIGCIILVFALIATIAVMIGLALIDSYDAGNLVGKAALIELCGLVICAIGSGEFK